MFTYSVVYSPPDAWLERDSFTLLCSCGIASGMLHYSIASAHNEPLHTHHIGDKRATVPATFSGEVTYSNGLPVHAVDLVGL